MSERHTILDSITSAFVPIHPEGHKFIAGFAVAARGKGRWLSALRPVLTMAVSGMVSTYPRSLATFWNQATRGPGR